VTVKLHHLLSCKFMVLKNLLKVKVKAELSHKYTISSTNLNQFRVSKLKFRINEYKILILERD